MRKDKISFIKQFYPISTTKSVAKSLTLSVSQVRTLAKRYHVKKCEVYKKELKQQLVIHRRNWYKQSISDFNPTHFQ